MTVALRICCSWTCFSVVDCACAVTVAAEKHRASARARVNDLICMGGSMMWQSGGEPAFWTRPGKANSGLNDNKQLFWANRSQWPKIDASYHSGHSVRPYPPCLPSASRFSRSRARACSIFPFRPWC
ncbi:Uncharacterised protein [Bordetella pertussis]|nr:Uncharacterised protein [Bordetella pertussis]